MNIDAQIKEFVRTSYPATVRGFLRFIGLILLGLNLVLMITILGVGIEGYLEFVLVSLIFFIGIVSVFPAVRIGYWTLRTIFNTAKKIVLGVLVAPKEIKQMSAFQRYVLILLVLLIGVIFAVVIIK